MTSTACQTFSDNVGSASPRPEPEMSNERPIDALFSGPTPPLPSSTDVANHHGPVADSDSETEEERIYMDNLARRVIPELLKSRPADRLNHSDNERARERSRFYGLSRSNADGTTTTQRQGGVLSAEALHGE